MRLLRCYNYLNVEERLGYYLPSFLAKKEKEERKKIRKRKYIDQDKKNKERLRQKARKKKRNRNRKKNWKRYGRRGIILNTKH